MGPELAPSFDIETNWTTVTGWTWAAGVWSYADTGLDYISASNTPIVAGKTYVATITFTSAPAASGYIFALFNSSANENYLGSYADFTGSGTIYTKVFTASSSSAGVRFYGNAGGVAFSVSEISIKEVTYNSSDPSATLKLIYHPNDVPRIEYNTDGTSKGLLVEESRTNLVTYSDLSSGWGETRSTLIQDALTSPEGVDNATALASDLTASNSHRSNSIIGTLSSGTYTFSAYLKRGETNAQLEIYVDPANSVQLRVLYVLFDLSNGTAKTPFETGSPTDVDYGIQDAGNGWYRCYVTTGNPDGTRVDAGITLSDHQVTLQNPVFNGTGNIGVYIYGAQFEAGAFPTSYIKTTGATATRSADVASIPVADFGYNQSEGTLFVEVSRRYSVCLAYVYS